MFPRKKREALREGSKGPVIQAGRSMRETLPVRGSGAAGAERARVRECVHEREMRLHVCAPPRDWLFVAHTPLAILHA